MDSDESIESFIHDLPIDIQHHIYMKVLEVRKPKKVLSNELKLDIESYPLLPCIVDNYKIMFNGQDHLGWVENAMINTMNDHHSIGIGGIYLNIHQDLRNAFPNLTDDDIESILLEGSHIKRLWLYMPPKKRIGLYLESMEFVW